MSLYRPKKNHCDTYRSHKLNHIDDATYNDHIKKKEDAKKEKDKDKIEGDLVFTVDLQSLVLSPKLDASVLYYRSKLSVHNFTIYDLKTNDGFCYIWNETEGGLSANEFSSNLDNITTSHTALQNNTVLIRS